MIPHAKDCPARPCCEGYKSAFNPRGDNFIRGGYCIVHNKPRALNGYDPFCCEGYQPRACTCGAKEAA